MTRRASHRAQAQRLLAERRAQKIAASEATPTPDPPSPIGFGGQALSPVGFGGQALSPQEPAPGCAQARPGWGGEQQTELTARARDLYENSSMPVRDIAAVVGVTERTLYKWARKGNWKPRYRWLPDGSRPPARHGARPRLTAPALERMQRFAPVKGAGGRFIARADRDRPVLRGIKATDPAAHARALAETVAAQRLNAAAEHEAALAQARDDRLRALEMTHRALRKLVRHDEERARRRQAWLHDHAGNREKLGPLAPDWSHDPAAAPLHISLNAAADWLDDAQERERLLRAQRGEGQ